MFYFTNSIISDTYWQLCIFSSYFVCIKMTTPTLALCSLLTLVRLVGNSCHEFSLFFSFMFLIGHKSLYFLVYFCDNFLIFVRLSKCFKYRFTVPICLLFVFLFLMWFIIVISVQFQRFSSASVLWTLCFFTKGEQLIWPLIILLLYRYLEPTAIVILDPKLLGLLRHQHLMWIYHES